MLGEEMGNEAAESGLGLGGDRILDQGPGRGQGGVAAEEHVAGAVPVALLIFLVMGPEGKVAAPFLHQLLDLVRHHEG
jgi:hypothetical protein